MQQRTRFLRSVESSKRPCEGPVAAVHSTARTHPGLQRQENQDSLAAIASAHFLVFAVADGIGGTRGGAVASRLATQTLRESLLAYEIIDERILSECLAKVNAVVLNKGLSNEELRGLGTTLVALGFCGTDLFIANVGDSRAYRFRNHQLVPLTYDHTVMRELVRSGLLTPEQGRDHPVSHLLTRALGTAGPLELDCWRSIDGPRPGDRYLLCSDGLHNLVSDDRIKQLLQERSASHAANRLIREALSRGGTDNVTVIVIDVDQSFPPGSGEGGAEEQLLEIQPIPQFMSNAAAPGKLGATVWRSDLPADGWKTSPDSIALAAIRQAESATVKLLRWWFLVFAVALALVVVVSILFRVDKPAGRLPETKSAAQLSASVLSNKAKAPDLGELIGAAPSVLNVPTTEDLVQQYRQIADSEERFERAGRDLKETREKLDLLTRKLALWSGRYRESQERDPLALAETVAVTSAEVREKKSLYEAARQEYLREAEVLLYNPVDVQQEVRVAEMKKQNDRLHDELVKAVRETVEHSLSQTIQQTMETSVRRDRLQAAVAILVR